jgi:hypothetical protein
MSKRAKVKGAMTHGRSLTDDQHIWYTSQPAEYRAAWWKWALTQPNFSDMVVRFVEKDASVIAAREAAARASHE